MKHMSFTCVCVMVGLTVLGSGSGETDTNNPTKTICGTGRGHDTGPDSGDMSRTFWTADLHDGTRIDLPSFLVHMGHKTVVAGVKRRQGPYPAALLPMVPQGRDERLWLSPVLEAHPGFQRITERDIVEHYYYLRSSQLIAGVDAFLCMFPASMCELWMPFNKTIFFIPAHRFFIGRCGAEPAALLLRNVMLMARSPRHLVAAASRYDAEYINYYTGLRVPIISMNSFFYVGCDKHPYNPSRTEFLYGPLQLASVPADFAAGFARAQLAAGVRIEAQKGIRIATAKSLYGRFQPAQLAAHPGVILVPYATCSYGITELYALNIPLFAPSLGAVCTRAFPGLLDDRTLSNPAYCPNGAALPHRHPDSHHVRDPESDRHDDFCYWAQFADIWTLPHITYFDSYADLVSLLANNATRANLAAISARMRAENGRRYREIRDALAGAIATRIQPASSVPATYAAALAAWAVPSFQAPP